uniref:Uncharacterized protein n=1 Tax=Romanomermis culicivorax TaxID=13658 RepID=A0A915K3B3_ROMCU
MTSKRPSPSSLFEKADLSGQVFFLTGGTSGIGRETARSLALKNATVVIASRDSIQAGSLIQEVKHSKLDAKIEFLELDLSDLVSVQECADSFLSRYSFLHCLILNAGVFNPVHRITDDDFESTFQINYMSQAYLAHQLIPALRNGAPSRLVVVSCEHYKGLGGKLPVNKVTWRHLSPTHKLYFNSAPYAYGLSKLCLMLFSYQFNRTYAGQGIISNIVDPGTCRNTNLYKNSKVASLFYKLKHPFRQNVTRGAAKVVYCALEKDVSNSGGKFFRDFRQARPPNRASNSQVAQLLWSRTEFMIQMFLERLKNKDHRSNFDRNHGNRVTL